MSILDSFKLPKPMFLFATGANSLWQLCPEEAILKQPARQPRPEERRSRNIITIDRLRKQKHRTSELVNFREVLKDFYVTDKEGGSAFDECQVLFAGWACTAVVVNKLELLIFGFNPFNKSALSPRVIRLNHPSCFVARPLRSAFGDHNGLYGVLDRHGNVHVITKGSETDPYRLAPIGTFRGAWKSRKLEWVAASPTGRVAVVFNAGDIPAMIQVLEFQAMDANPESILQAQGAPSLNQESSTSESSNFIQWYCKPNNPLHQPSAKFKLPGRAKCLKANKSAFILLMESGDIYTWGDGRYPTCLGRIPTEDQPAATPFPVDYLTGMNVIHIDSRGWFSGAVTAAGEAFVWGTSPNGLDIRGQIPNANQPVTEIILDVHFETPAPYLPSLIEKRKPGERSFSNTVHKSVNSSESNAKTVEEDEWSHPSADSANKERSNPTNHQPKPSKDTSTEAHAERTETKSLDSSSSHMTFIMDLAIGNAHALALEDNGDVWVVGDNSHGQLGLGRDLLGSRVNKWTRVPNLMKPALENVGIDGQVGRVVAGDDTSFAVIGIGMTDQEFRICAE